MKTRLFEELADALEGSVDHSPLARLLYSQDASIYQEEPLGVVYPAGLEDLRILAAWALTNDVPLIPRAGGTSLAGQCVGRGLVVDVSRHMNRILDIDPDGHTAVVQPGVIQDDLNDAAARHGLQFAPDTSTSRQACIGGMIGNNACGAYSVIHGTTRDHVRDLTLVTGSGSVIYCAPLSAEELQSRLLDPGEEGRLYRCVCGLVEEHHDEILKRYPKPGIVRRNMGYALDRLAVSQPWAPRGPAFNLCHLVCGSEGTLGLVAEATVRLVPRPINRRLVCAHFKTVDEAARAVPVILRHQPAAVELMDGHILEATRRNRAQAANRFWVQGNPGAVLAIEFHEGALDQRVQDLIGELEACAFGYAFMDIGPADMPRVWALRKAGLGLLTGEPGDTRSVTAIEDTAVHPDDLHEYLRGIRSLLDKYGIDCVHYGHASVGLIHLRPMLNLKQARDLEIFQALMDDTAKLVRSFGGCLSGEHGDGRLRSPYLPAMLGVVVTGCHQDIKRAFDPSGLCNPGKIVDPGPVTDHLRAHPGSATPEVDTYFDWSAEEGLVRAVERCNGSAFCRQSAGRGTMCPSYMATGDEALSTRGRANVLRLLLTGTSPDEAWTRPELIEVMHSCLSCKGCASECPSSVDMARMKAEVLQQHMDRQGVDRRSVLLGHFRQQAEKASRTPRWANLLLRSRLLKNRLGLAPERKMPPFARRSFSAAFQRSAQAEGTGVNPERRALLFVDEFTDYLEPHIAWAAWRVLRHAGYDVQPVTGLDSGRSLISKGFLAEARDAFEQALDKLAPYAARGWPIIGLEPSAILGFRDEAPDLVRSGHRSLARHVAGHCVLFDEWAASVSSSTPWSGLGWKAPVPARILVHVHCHQKALCDSAPVLQALAVLPDTEITVLPTGCCGMAGSYGYEQEHYALSMKIAEQVLFPALRADPEALVCAAGTSCRHQILDGLGRTALHPAEILDQALGGASSDLRW